MNDLIMLSTPVLTGLFLGQSAFLYRTLGHFVPDRQSYSPAPLPEQPQESTFPENEALWSEVSKESRLERLNLAAKALDAIPDVSCDAVAEAFDLPKLSVRRLSSKLRRKGKQVTEVGTYTRDQIWASTVEECPF